MPTKVEEYPGGTVTKVGERNWVVNAPDNRLVGKYPTKKQAIEKAQHWDKYDAFASLGDICAAIAPFSTLLVLENLFAILPSTKDKFKEHSIKDIQKAMLIDVVLILLAQLKAEGKINNGKIKEVMIEVAKELFPDKEAGPF